MLTTYRRNILVSVVILVPVLLAGIFFPGRSSANSLTPMPTPTVMPTETPTTTAPAGPSASTDGYGLQPQPYIPHPSLYLETGHTGTDEQKTQTWTLGVLDGSTLVYGGYRVDGVKGGVYGAISGPTTVTITVTDGFVSIVTNNWAQQEYCFRLSQAIQYGWAHDHLHPLQGWSCQ
jgi:hypothetical protein